MGDIVLGKSVNADDAERWVSAAAEGLVDGEEMLAVFRANQIKPAADVAFVTSARIILCETARGAFRFKREHRIAHVRTVTANKLGLNGQVAITTDAGDKFRLSVGGYRSAKGDAVAMRDMIERARTHPDHQLATANLPPVGPDGDPHSPTAAPEATPTRFDAKAEARQRALAERRGELQNRLETRTEEARSVPELGPDVTFVGDRASSKSAQVILDHCTDDERPWLVIASAGSGVLAAFEDRLMIIKTGAVTSWMAGSLGGGRSATFHFTDVTGIEYNSGLMNGVLEVLTASYSGTLAKDYWRGAGRSRNADASDPHTLSNTLPLTRAYHAKSQPHLNNLRSRISNAKRPGSIAPSPAPAAPQADVMEQLRQLGSLRDAGVLTEHEFDAKKAELLRRI